MDEAGLEPTNLSGRIYSPLQFPTMRFVHIEFRQQDSNLRPVD